MDLDFLHLLTTPAFLGDSELLNLSVVLEHLNNVFVTPLFPSMRFGEASLGKLLFKFKGTIVLNPSKVCSLITFVLYLSVYVLVGVILQLPAALRVDGLTLPKGADESTPPSLVHHAMR